MEDKSRIYIPVQEFTGKEWDNLITEFGRKYSYKSPISRQQVIRDISSPNPLEATVVWHQTIVPPRAPKREGRQLGQPQG